MSPSIGEWGEILPFSSPCVRHCDSVRQLFLLHPTKGPRTFLIPTRSSQVSRGYTDTEDAQQQRTHICREILMTQASSSVGGGFSIVRTLKANGAPTETFRGRSEDHFEFIAADADRSIRSPEGKLSEGPS